MSFYRVENGKLSINLHEGQARAWESEKRFVAICAGSQGGKTSFSPLWLWREIQRCGPGDYGYICPTFTLMEVKALPEVKRWFQHTLKLGTYTTSPVRRFTFSPEGAERMFGRTPEVETCIYFGYAENPDSLESATYKAVVCDEAGQPAFKLGSWEALMRRLAINQGRALIATTPYNNTGWLKTHIYDKWRNGDPDIDVIQFASNMNPAFPQAEFERAQRDLPWWKFALFYLGQFERPAGLIYDCFDDDLHVVPPFVIPETWPRYLGLDFGGVNTAGLFFASDDFRDPTIVYAYREYLAGGRTAKEHAKALLEGEPRVPSCVGGSKSEGQWRAEFRACGLPVREPDQPDVEVGIQRVYGAIKRGEVRVFSNLAHFLEQKRTYARKLDKAGNPTEAIEAKETYHLLDAERYILGWLKKSTPPLKVTVAPKGKGGFVQEMPEVW